MLSGERIEGGVVRYSNRGSAGVESQPSDIPPVILIGGVGLEKTPGKTSSYAGEKKQRKEMNK